MNEEKLFYFPCLNKLKDFPEYVSNFDCYKNCKICMSARKDLTSKLYKYFILPIPLRRYILN